MRGKGHIGKGGKFDLLIHKSTKFIVNLVAAVENADLGHANLLSGRNNTGFKYRLDISSRKQTALAEHQNRGRKQNGFQQVTTGDLG